MENRSFLFISLLFKKINKCNYNVNKIAINVSYPLISALEVI